MIVTLLSSWKAKSLMERCRHGLKLANLINQNILLKNKNKHRSKKYLSKEKSLELHRNLVGSVNLKYS